MTRAFTVAGFGRCWINDRGYPQLRTGPARGRYLHRVVWERIAGRAVKPGYQIHHMNGRLCWCPHQLCELPAELNRRAACRDPYTGQLMALSEYQRLYGDAGRITYQQEDPEGQEVPF